MTVTVEGERIEYKAGWNPDAILRTLCAFANDFENLGGGYVVIGQDCDEAGVPVFPPVGLREEDLDRIQRELLTFCNLMQPPYFPLLSVERWEGRTLLVLWVPGGQNRPYKVPKSVTAKTKEYRYFIRRYASTVEAKGEDEQELISLTAKVPHDDRFSHEGRVGYTGTPIDKTEKVFGDYIDKYTMRQAIADGVTLEIIYEGRTHNAEVTDTAAMDAMFKDVFHDYTLPEHLQIMGAGGRRAYLEAEPTIAAKARDMVEHYLTHVFPNGYKAQIVATSREAAVRYKTHVDEALKAAVAAAEARSVGTDELESLKRLKSDVVISGTLLLRLHERTAVDVSGEYGHGPF